MSRGLDLSLREWALRHQHEILSSTTWMGVRMCKNPLDAWVTQEIVHRVRPDVIVELGSLAGGSALFYAHLLDILGNGGVISVDIDRSGWAVDHPRIVALSGDASDPAIVADVRERCAGARTLVVHDADHERASVLRDLRLYADLVSVDSYLIVEDGIVDLFPPGTELHPETVAEGPLRAIENFLSEDDRFVVDERSERYLVSWNPSGYLRRVA